MDSQSECSVFEEILTRMNVAGEFTTAVLTSEDGLPVAAAPSPAPYDAETLAAMVSMIRDFIQQTQTQLGFAQVDEVSMVIADHSRLICRYFDGAGKPFVLAVIAPPNHSYRRLTTGAIREIRAAWNQSAPVAAQARPE